MKYSKEERTDDDDESLTISEQDELDNQASWEEAEYQRLQGWTHNGFNGMDRDA